MDRSEAARPVVCLAASPGGHMAELQAAASAFSSWRLVWVTGRSPQADALREGGEEVRLLPAWGRDPPGLRGFPPNLVAAARALRGCRPSLVVTTGAGMVVPFVLMARAAGAELVLVESMARVKDASLTSRLLAPVARSVVVQWPEMAGAFPRARVCRPALLERALSAAGEDRAGEDRKAGDGAGRAGTFVSVGTRPEPFDRLLELVDRAVSGGTLPEPVVAQSGNSRYRPAAFRAEPWLAPAEMARAMEGARYVVCHGGAAMVSAAIGTGRRPLVLARRRDAGEHRTEHQEQLVERLAADGAVVALRGGIGGGELRAADEPWTGTGIDADLPAVATAVREEAEAARKRH